jgi:hypothetical protein
VEKGHYLLRDLFIAVEPGRYKYPLGATAQGYAGRHGRVDTVLTGFVGGGSYYTSFLRAAAHQHWLAPQLRIVQLLYCGVKGIQISVKDMVHLYYFILSDLSPASEKCHKNYWLEPGAFL